MAAFSAPSMQTDLTLLRACQAGDRKAQLRLYDQCYSLMMSVCIRYCRDRQEAGARLNMAFLKVLQHLDQFEPSGSFPAWVSKITLRTLIDEFRSQQRHYTRHVYHGHELTDESNGRGEGSFREIDLDIDQVMEVIGRLPDMTREVFNLFAIDGYAHKEIAGLMAISENTSKWHVHEARRRIKEMLFPQRKIQSIR